VLQGLLAQALFRGLADQMTDPARMLEQTNETRAALAHATELDPAQRESLRMLMDALDRISQTQGQDTQGTEDTAGGGMTLDIGGMIESVDVNHDESGKPRSAYDITFPSSIVWGLMGCATAFATTIVRERRAGTLLRLRVSPLSRAHVMVGKGLACMLAGLGASALLLGLGVLALGVRVGNPGLLLVALVCGAACFTGIMMLMSVIGRTEAAVAGGSWVVMMPLAMIGGGMIPLIAMPPWLLLASNVSPFKWAIYAIEGAVWRDLSLAESLPAMGILLGIAVACLTLGVVIMRRQDP
jgi:ABC-2 type transport system permease protein